MKMNEKIVEILERTWKDGLDDGLDEGVKIDYSLYSLRPGGGYLKEKAQEIRDALITEPVQVEWVKGENMYSMAISDHIELVVYTASRRPSWEVNVNGDSVYSGDRDSLDDAQRTAKNAYNTNIANRPEVKM